MIIPTYRRPEKLHACLRAFGEQTLDPSRFEVLIGFDGYDPEGAEAARRACPERIRGSVRLVEGDRVGLTGVRNRLMATVRGWVLLSTNDDVLPEPGFLEAHLRAHEQARAERRVVVISGASPWVVHQPDRLFDRLVRETSMVFFYNGMDTPESLAQPDKDWGFRHAWGLNMSMPTQAVREVGNFTVFPAWYGYEDNEIAFKLKERFSAPVLYRPDARLWHDHRMEPDAYLTREFSLGYAAFGVAQTSPAFARATFGRAVNEAPELSYSREFVRRERTGAARALPTFRALTQLPPSLLDGPAGATLRDALYQQHLLLKRWMWRAGLIAAAENRPMQVEWPE